jgi:hydrogenase nickel incorporation protein HypA/HybF
MHELSITQSLLDVALRHAEKAEAQRITRLNLVIGELASIVDESVQFCWDLVSKGTMAEGAELSFERVPGRLRCTGCGREFALGGREYVCPDCGQRQVVAVGGDDFRLESIEIE